MTNEQALREKAIKAFQNMQKIVIETDADFTPKGKRRALIVKHTRNGKRTKPHIRWYVGRAAYRSLEPTKENEALSLEWLNAA